MTQNKIQIRKVSPDTYLFTVTETLYNKLELAANLVGLSVDAFIAESFFVGLDSA